MFNVYEESTYASEYSALDWQGTYYLIKRDLPEILHRHVKGGRALDFGCGAGRSTRLLRECGFDAVGIDVAAQMIERAQELDPSGSYTTISDGDFSQLAPASFDLILACYPFDNIAGDERKISLMNGLAGLLRPGGVFVNIVSSAEIYWHEWTTFTTAAFPENRQAKNGDVVRIVTKDFAGSPVCDDILCDDEAYRAIYNAAGLEPIEALRPLGRPEDPVDWVSEETVAPWVIWVLGTSA